MKPTDDDSRLAARYSFQNDRSQSGFGLEALREAKARQDRSHAVLDSWIANAIAELRS